MPYLGGRGVGGCSGGDHVCYSLASAWVFQERVGVGSDCWALLDHMRCLQDHSVFKPHSALVAVLFFGFFFK